MKVVWYVSKYFIKKYFIVLILVLKLFNVFWYFYKILNIIKDLLKMLENGL